HDDVHSRAAATAYALSARPAPRRHPTATPRGWVIQPMPPPARVPTVEVMSATALPVLAGTLSTVLFASSTLPMVIKAARTKDLSSYSLGNLVLANVGNAVHSVYVFSLP